MWIDGECKKCGYPVMEMRHYLSSNTSDKHHYKNTCLNPNCEENKWHYTEEGKQADYYIPNESYCEVWKIPEE